MSKDMCFEKAFSDELASNPLAGGVLDLGWGLMVLSCDKSSVFGLSFSFPNEGRSGWVQALVSKIQWIATKTFGFLAMTTLFTPAMT